MNARELRELNQEEIRRRVADLKLAGERLREEVLAGKEKDQTKWRRKKREIAQALTVWREKELAQGQTQVNDKLVI